MIPVLDPKRISQEIGKLRGEIDKIKEETKKGKLDRLFLKSCLIEMRTLCEKLRHTNLAAWGSVSLVAKMVTKDTPYVGPPEFKVFIQTIEQLGGEGVAIRLISNAYDTLGFYVNNSLGMLDIPPVSLPEDILRDSLVTSVTNMEASLINVQNAWLMVGIVPLLDSYGRLGELLSLVRLDEKWVIANCYLTAMEIVVNNRLKAKWAEKGMDEEQCIRMLKSKSFNEKYLELLKMERKEPTILEKEIPSSFWKVRNEVVHAGYSPTIDDFELIVNWTKKIISSLF